MPSVTRHTERRKPNSGGRLACGRRGRGGQAGRQETSQRHVTMQSRKKASFCQLAGADPAKVRLAAGGMPSVTRTFSAAPPPPSSASPALSVGFLLFSALRAALRCTLRCGLDGCAASRRSGELEKARAGSWGVPSLVLVLQLLLRELAWRADAPRWRSSIEQVPSLLRPSTQAGAQPQQGQHHHLPPAGSSQGWLGWAGRMEVCGHPLSCVLLVLRQPEKSGVWQGSVTSSNLLLIGWRLAHRSLRGPCLRQCGSARSMHSIC